MLIVTAKGDGGGGDESNQALKMCHVARVKFLKDLNPSLGNLEFPSWR